MRAPRLALAVLMALAVPALGDPAPASATSLKEHLLEQRRAPLDLARIAPGSRMISASYGDDPLQSLDVYLPARPADAPIIVMIHGGGWFEGDKAERHVVQNKLAHWLPQGYIFVSLNYRLTPQAMAYEQAQDAAKALRWVQEHAHDWGGRRDKLILMGHSSGGHLAALLSAKPSMVGKPWAGTIVLDGATLDVPRKMRRVTLPFYKAAFGTDPQYWTKASPASQWTKAAVPMLLACSEQRKDKPCSEAEAFQKMTARSGIETQVLPLLLSHAEVNDTLGETSSYTAAVDTFIRKQLAGR